MLFSLSFSLLLLFLLLFWPATIPWISWPLWVWVITTRWHHQTLIFLPGHQLIASKALEICQNSRLWSLSNVGKTIINHTLGNGLYHLFMVIFQPCGFMFHTYSGFSLRKFHACCHCQVGCPKFAFLVNEPKNCTRFPTRLGTNLTNSINLSLVKTKPDLVIFKQIQTLQQKISSSAATVDSPGCTHETPAPCFTTKRASKDPGRTGLARGRWFWWLPHVTTCYHPFVGSCWVMLGDVGDHLCGVSHYKPFWGLDRPQFKRNLKHQKDPKSDV